MWARWKCEGAGPKAEHQKQNFRYWGFLWFDLVFGHWCRTIEVINVKRWIPPPPQKKRTENKKKTEGTSKTARTNHTFATKKVHEEKHEHKDTTWKNTTTKKICHKGQKSRTRKSENAIFPLIFWCLRKEKLIRGRFFWYSSVDGEVFGPSSLGVQFQKLSVRKRYYTTKIVALAFFRVPTNERKSSNFKS